MGDICTWARAEFPETACPPSLSYTILASPALFITFRNDKGQPKEPSGIYQYGITEWQDLHAAAEYVLSQPGAREIVASWSQHGWWES